jgi:hypothetical protein
MRTACALDLPRAAGFLDCFGIDSVEGVISAVVQKFPSSSPQPKQGNF